MWAFTYKFDEDGYLFKYKARLVVCGDLQEQYGDTYAATLVARLFRALGALACAFNLKAKQYDVPNAFLNANVLHHRAGHFLLARPTLSSSRNVSTTQRDIYS
jgi:hypothetical protein